MAETTAYYDSPLTGEELDEAFRKLTTLDNSVAAAAQSEEKAAYWANQAQTIAQGALGWYQNADELRRVHPTGENGQWAIVGNTDTIWTWDSDTGDWINTATRIDLSNYYTKEQADRTFATAAQGTLAESAVQFRRVWVNEDPANAFEDTTIELDLSDVSCIMVLSRVSRSIGYLNPPVFALSGFPARIVSDALSAGVIYRNVSFSQKGVTFSGSTNASGCIPYAIYSVKL